MMFTPSVFIGIDPASSKKSFTYAALDSDLRLIALADGEMEDVASFLAGQPSVMIAVNAPAGVNRGLVREKMKKEMQTPHQIRGAEIRLAEHELRAHGIAVTGTPSNASLCPAWIQAGFALYRKLEKDGFKKFPSKGSANQVLETHPQACFSVLAGAIPQPKPSLEGRMQRQLILYERGVRIKDPMDFFEEITRHKMIKGNWPFDMLYLPEQLDALIAAYTAWFAINNPNEIILLGDESEGRIVLPQNELKEKY